MVSIRRALVRCPQSFTANEREFGSAITVSNLDKPSFDCADLPGIVPDDVDMNVAVVNNSLSFSSLNRNLFFFNLKARMFSKLMVNESLLSSHGDYENFFDTVLSNNIGKFGMSRYYVDLSRNSLNYEAVKKKWINLAIDANEEISADYAYEQSHKSIDNIYFNTISKHIYEFNEAQWDTIYETAFKCPYTYGSAVFKARDLFRLKIDTIEFDDRVLCDTSQMKYSDNFKEISNGFRLYPNPSKDYFILQSFKTDSSNLTVFITNVVGTIIDKRKFDTFKQSMLISCEDYSAGLYFCLIKEDDMTVWRSKFIVVK